MEAAFLSFYLAGSICILFSVALSLGGDVSFRIIPASIRVNRDFDFDDMIEGFMDHK